MNFNSFFKATMPFLTLGLCTSCSENKIPSYFHYHELSREEISPLRISDKGKAYQVKVKKIDLDSVEVSFVKDHPTYCPIDGIITQKADSVFMNIGHRCDPNQEEVITESATLNFVWRFKLKNPAKYIFTPREAGYGKTWPIPIEK